MRKRLARSPTRLTRPGQPARCPARPGAQRCAPERQPARGAGGDTHRLAHVLAGRGANNHGLRGRGARRRRLSGHADAGEGGGLQRLHVDGLGRGHEVEIRQVCPSRGYARSPSGRCCMQHLCLRAAAQCRSSAARAAARARRSRASAAMVRPVAPRACEPLCACLTHVTTATRRTAARAGLPPRPQLGGRACWFWRAPPPAARRRCLWRWRTRWTARSSPPTPCRRAPPEWHTPAAQKQRYPTDVLYDSPLLPGVSGPGRGQREAARGAAAGRGAPPPGRGPSRGRVQRRRLGRRRNGSAGGHRSSRQNAHRRRRSGPAPQMARPSSRRALPPPSDTKRLTLRAAMQADGRAAADATQQRRGLRVVPRGAVCRHGRRRGWARAER